jgi:serine O-acetyltransferase
MHSADKDGLECLAGKLGQAITGDHLANIWEGCQLPGRDAVEQVLDRILAVLFPGVFGHEVVAEADLNDFILESLASVRSDLSHQIAVALDYRDSLSPGALTAGARILNADDPRCGENAAKGAAAALALLEALPVIRQVLGQDLLAAYEGDPAAGSVVEVLMSYPFVQAISVHRIAHELYRAGVPLLPRMMSEVAHSRTGSDIHPGASIGPGFFIDHGTGVVIGETAVIGRGVKLYQGVTLGALSFPKDQDGNPIKGIKRHPNIEDNVTIYAGATVLGGQTTIGKGSVIGGNCWITSSVPPDTVVMSERAQRKHK